MVNPTQTLEMIKYWTAQEDSNQKEAVLAYWVKQAEKLVKAKTTKENKDTFKALAMFYKVPAKKAGETVSQQAHRLTTGKGYTMTIEQVIATL